MTRMLVGASALLLMAAAVATAADPPPAAADGIPWVRSWERAQEEAARQHKLILHFSLIGDLDKPDC